MKAYGTCWGDLSEYRLDLQVYAQHVNTPPPPENYMGWNHYTTGFILECTRAKFIENERELIYHDVLCTM